MSLPSVRLYNTLTRKKEELRPLIEGVVRIYSCGPTVYRYVHVGNLRTFMLPDLTDDTLERGEDKMLVSARLEKKSTEEIAAFYTEAFMADVSKLNIRRAGTFPRATQYIPRMIELIETLLEKGHAYLVDGTVYYDIASFPRYGRLSRNTTDKLLSGVRAEADPHKRHPSDFTLWKAAGEHRMQVWPSPWGPGYPGWHIECSAMSMSILGERFDIHTGGADNVFPHHEAEIAQSEAVTGHQVVGLWMHGGLLMLSGARMAKSAGNFYRITELEEQGFDPLAFRYLALQAKYRAPLNFSTDGLAGADRALRQLRERVADWSRHDEDPVVPGGKEWDARFRDAIADDLDFPGVMALMAGLIRSNVASSTKAALLLDWDTVLGLDLSHSNSARALPPGAAELLAERDKARAGKDFARSDQLRDALRALGVQVSDSSLKN